MEPAKVNQNAMPVLSIIIFSKMGCNPAASAYDIPNYFIFEIAS